MPRTPGPNSHHLYGVQGISQWQGSRSLFLSTQGPPVLPHLLIPEKLKSFRSVVGVDGLAPTPQITKPLPCTLQNTPFSHSFLVLPNRPTPILGKDLLSKFKPFLTVPNLSPDLAWLLLLEPTISLPPPLPSSSVNLIVWDRVYHRLPPYSHLYLSKRSNKVSQSTSRSYFPNTSAGIKIQHL